jgi:hypothetical protein
VRAWLWLSWRSWRFRRLCVPKPEGISLKRLAAVPWTPFCIQCRELADRSQSDSADNLDKLLVNAA